MRRFKILNGYNCFEVWELKNFGGRARAYDPVTPNYRFSTREAAEHYIEKREAERLAEIKAEKEEKRKMRLAKWQK